MDRTKKALLNLYYLMVIEIFFTIKYLQEEKMIEIQKINKIYSNGYHAVKDISLEIKTGDIFGVIGLSGAGKSSLIRLLNRLEEPTSGKIIIDGVDITSLSKKDLLERRKK